MDSTNFDLDWVSARVECHEGFTTPRIVVFPVPTLSAYAVAHSNFYTDSGFADTSQLQNIEGRDFEIVGDSVIWRSPVQPFIPADGTYRLIVHYHGIRDYEALFPSVQDLNIRRRIAQFQEEADTVFQQKAWMSYVILSTAVLEGLLVYRLGNKKLVRLIDEASESGLINDAGRNALHNARDRRNLVHASRAQEPYVSRLEAMDVRTSMDRLIKALSRETINPNTASSR